MTRLFPTIPGSEAGQAAALHRAVQRLSIMSVVAGNHNRDGAEAAWEPLARGPQPNTHTNPAAHLWLFEKAAQLMISF